MVTTPEQKLWKYLRARLPRIITQLSRDPDSPTFGSWDRNFWHYKIRDFSSIILQQGMMIVDALEDYKGDNNPLYKHPLASQWVDASLDFWAGQQLKNGSFNEYYPYEAGYPPTAFSLFAAGVIFKNRAYRAQGEKVTRAVQKAIDWLLKHPEKEALNQEAAGLAGIVLCSKLPGIKVDSKSLENRLQWFYKSQSAEGWYPEYDGPDTAYLSVTIDCLWEMYEVANDERALNAMEKAIGYISAMMSVSAEMPVMINSRNTDYLVTYGMTRMAMKGNKSAAAIVQRLIGRLDSPDHFLNRTDERYTVHYVYASYFRSIPFLESLLIEDTKIPADEDFFQYYPEAGIVVSHAEKKSSIYVNLRKGGIVNAFNTQGISKVDFGYRIKMPGNKVAVTHWQHPSYQIIDQGNDTYLVSGRMTLHGWMVPGPFKHIVLRGISLIFGNRLIPILKKIMIFNLKESGWSFSRRISFREGKLLIEDGIYGSGLEKIEIYHAPHYSLRHVSSAGQFMTEELLTISNSKGKIEDNKMLFYSEFEISGNE